MITTRKSDLTPIIKTFVLTQEDYTQHNGISLTFFEPLSISTAQQIIGKYNVKSPSQKKEKNIYELESMLSVYFEDVEHNFDDLVGDLMVSRTICFLVKNQVVNLMVEQLKLIYCMIVQNLDVSHVIQQIVDEFKLPPTGMSFQYQIGPTQLNYYSPNIDQLPLLDYKLSFIFSFFSIESLLLLYTNVLLENQIILISSCSYKLSLVANSLRALIFPFNWEHIYIPHLPAALKQIAEAPLPFIIGIQSSSLINVGSSKSNAVLLISGQ